ncbi:YveK family protein [Turicibacter bilis]|uniref:YveK family protein n=1 Tax=Turicibacter bilis TaxID=2735723 RepID=UPI0031BA0A3E
MEERTLEIQELFKLFKKKIWILIGATFVSTILGFFYASTIDTMYRARVKVYVGDSANFMSTYTSDQMQSYENFISTFKEVIMIDDFLDETLSKNELNLKANVVRDGLSFSSAENSTILEINYTCEDQIIARDVLKALTSEYARQAKIIMPTAQVQVIDSIKVFPIEPNTISIIATAFIGGLLLSVGMILVIEYSNDVIKKKETLESLLPVPVIGQLPHFNDKEER